MHPFHQFQKCQLIKTTDINTLYIPVMRQSFFHLQKTLLTDNSSFHQLSMIISAMMTRRRLLMLLHNDSPTPLCPTIAHYLVEEQMKRPPILSNWFIVSMNQTSLSSAMIGLDQWWASSALSVSKQTTRNTQLPQKALLLAKTEITKRTSTHAKNRLREEMNICWRAFT